MDKQSSQLENTGNVKEKAWVHGLAPKCMTERAPQPYEGGVHRAMSVGEVYFEPDIHQALQSNRIRSSSSTQSVTNNKWQNSIRAKEAKESPAYIHH